MRRLALALAIGLSATAVEVTAQQIRTYTQAPGGATTRALGYPVPLPVTSIRPVDGFRDYASLHARHQALDLASADVRGQVLGATQNGRPIWGYVIGDGDSDTPEGFAESSALINVATHAREWQAPEVGTGILEHLVAQAGDQGMVRYVLDHVHLVLIPVHNIDGFLQTQRFPTQVIVGQDPTSPSDWPRDGRMRRKNMRGVDEVLTTFADHLGGVDLNRNHAPYWGPNSGGGGSPNPNALTFYGTEPHSEAENQALDVAIELARADRLRLAQDIHSFGAVFFSGNTTGRVNAIQAQLTARMAAHHRVVAGRRYTNVPDPPGAGIGTAAEYLADRFRVPAWTLELEPGSGGGTEYGGLADSHSGFILPASEIARVRDGWGETQALALYHQAGPPHLEAVEIRDAANGELRFAARWLRDGARRSLQVRRDVPLLAGRRYVATLGFGKPMRHRIDGTVVAFPGQTAALQPTVSLASGGNVVAAGTGEWLAEPGLRYRDDSVRVPLDLPPALPPGTAELRVAAQDLVGQALDADPATVVDWAAGWAGYENDAGVAGDTGGEDRRIRPRVARGEPGRVRVLRPGRWIAGNTVPVLLVRAAPGPALSISARSAGAGIDAPSVEASWSAGEGGARRLHVPLPAGAEAGAWIQLTVTTGDDGLDQAAVILDEPARAVRAEE